LVVAKAAVAADNAYKQQDVCCSRGLLAELAAKDLAADASRCGRATRGPCSSGGLAASRNGGLGCRGVVVAVAGDRVSSCKVCAAAEAWLPANMAA
jgi:hypothetical protein